MAVLFVLDVISPNLLGIYTVHHYVEKISLQVPFKPVKYFSIDRVFRNENLDATHLAEFHQIEGVVADYGLTLGDLIGTINEFFRKLGRYITVAPQVVYNTLVGTQRKKKKM